MFTLIISLVVSTGAVVYCESSGASIGWTITCGIVGFLACQIIIGLLVRKKVNIVNADLQGILMGGQKRINQKIQAFQNKPTGGMKAMQMLLEKEQTQFLERALDFTSNLEPFCKWNLLMPKQIDTMRMQFNYQMKNFDAVDKILAKKGLLNGVIMMEPITAAMKMARQHKNKDFAALEKSYEKFAKKFKKGGKSVLIYGLYSWSLIKQGELEKAREALYQGKEETQNELLVRNWELLSNDKPKKFSNAALGDEWYSLYLETPAQPKQQRVRGGGKRGGMMH